MQILILLGCIIVAIQAAGLTPEQLDKLKLNYKTCSERSKVDKSLVDDARNGNIVENSTPLDSFFTCMFTESGFIDGDSKLQKPVLRAKLPAEVTNEMFDKIWANCSKAEKEAKEKVARVAYKCFLTESPIKIQLIQVP